MKQLGLQPIWIQNAIVRIVWMFGGLLAAIVVLQILQPAVEGLALVLIGGAVAVFPAFLWLTILARQERASQRPKTMIRTVFVFSALLAAAVGIPLVQNVFRSLDWMDGSVLVGLAGSILVIGFTQELLKFIAVYWTVYHTDEIHERMDAVIYATVASLGYATILNLNYVLSNPRLDLAVAIVRVTITVLSQAAFADFFGYFLGRAKFDGNAILRLPSGLILAAILNGAFQFGRDWVDQGIRMTLSNSLIAAMILALVILPTILYLMRRTTHKPVIPSHLSPKDRYAGVVAICLAILALAFGWGLKNSVETRTRVFQDTRAGIQLEYPASWGKGTSEETIAVLTDRRAESTFANRIEMRVVESGDKELAVLTKEWTYERAAQLTGYRVFSIAPEGDGSTRTTIRYSYVAEPRAGLDATATLAVVVQGEDLLILKGKKLYVVSFESDQSLFAQMQNSWRAVVASVRID